MEKNVAEQILKEYESSSALYSKFADIAERLISDLLRENNLRAHSISSRLKEKESLRRKIDRSIEEYSELEDITDICGIRIVTYFADEVDAVAKIIEKEFEIDRENSVDKRRLLDPDRFGYLSLHYVAKLPSSRLQLTEYQRFSTCNIEIQIRSILQHTWAEIEHDLGYKTEQSVPREIKRRFSRLAGLLEIADDEFAQIRRELAEYEKHVPEKITATPSTVTIDQASLHAYVSSSDIVKSLDNRIAGAKGASLVEDLTMIGKRVSQLNYVGLDTIEDVNNALQEYGEIVVRFAEKWLEGSDVQHFYFGICLFYLCYVLVSRNGSTTEVMGYLETLDIGILNMRKSAADRIIEFYEELTRQR